MATEAPTVDTAVTEGAAAGLEVSGTPRRFTRAVLGNRKAVVGAVILLIMVFVAAFPGLIAPYDPQAIVGPPNASPSSSYLLGTTSLGQDVFSQLIWGTRLTL